MVSGEGVLLRAADSRFGDRVFLCREGRRHWVSNAAWLAENGFTWPDDVYEVAPAMLEAFMPGRPAAQLWGDSDWSSPPLHSVLAMREMLVSQLTGRGFEIGAGANPMPIPLRCDVQYVDLYDASDLAKQAYEGQNPNDFMRPDLRASFDALDGLDDEGADFLVACHVIEHTRSPITSIADAYRKLRPGGHIALVVPEMSRTFDRLRALTALEHLIEDHQAPDRMRDVPHFQEFYSKAFPTAADAFETVWRTNWEAGFPIHYHTWTHESFASMVRYISDSVCRFEAVWSHPALPAADCNEFYVLMRKPQRNAS